VVYATDYEFPNGDTEESERFVEFIAGADVIISDTQYTYLESVAREGWGHSSSFSAIDLALKAGVGFFLLFHHDPEHNDLKLFDNLEKTRTYHRIISDQGPMRIELAVEGLTLEI
jgi:ribonuclease BN (tRNA processing enzyme)